jgi:CheY-like chemotaxis protein
VLVVDDEPEVASLLAEILARAGHRVVVANNGTEALERLAARAYDVILSDLRMPGLDGPTLFRQVERLYPALAGRFVFLTGDALGGDTLAFLEASRAPRLEKPFTLAAVLEVVDHVLRARPA